MKHTLFCTLLLGLAGFCPKLHAISFGKKPDASFPGIVYSRNHEGLLCTAAIVGEEIATKKPILLTAYRCLSKDMRNDPMEIHQGSIERKSEKVIAADVHLNIALVQLNLMEKQDPYMELKQEDLLAQNYFFRIARDAHTPKESDMPPEPLSTTVFGYGSTYFDEKKNNFAVPPGEYRGGTVVLMPALQHPDFLMSDGILPLADDHSGVGLVVPCLAVPLPGDTGAVALIGKGSKGEIVAIVSEINTPQKDEKTTRIYHDPNGNPVVIFEGYRSVATYVNMASDSAVKLLNKIDSKIYQIY